MIATTPQEPGHPTHAAAPERDAPKTRGEDGRMARWAALAAILIWVLSTQAWIRGDEVLLQRDVLLANAPYKAYGAQQLAEGRIPAINTAWGLGQPFRGNPGTLAFYPGNLLYLVLPFWSAFGSHYALHWLLAGLTMAYLTRRLGGSPSAAVLASVTYCGGLVVASLSFYNTLAVLAWWPLVLAGVAGRRLGPGEARPSFRSQVTSDPPGLVLGAVAFGLAILGGEPVALLLLGPTAWLLAWDRSRGALVSLFRCAVVFSLGALLAAPQLVATARVLPFSSRGGPGAETDESLGFSFHLPRLLELVVPFPFGVPFRHDVWGTWAADSQQLPYYYALYAGLLTVPLMLLGLRRHRSWGAAVVVGILFAWLGADFRWLSDLSAGTFRHPEKFLLWAAPFVPLLAAAGLDRVRRRVALGERLFVSLAVAAGGLLAWIAIRFDAFVGWHQGRLRPEAPVGAAQAQAVLWSVSLAALLACLLLGTWMLRRRRIDGLVPLQLLTLLPLLALLPTDSTTHYGPQPLREHLGTRTEIWSPLHGNLSHLTVPAPRYVDSGMRSGSRWIARDLDPSVGIPLGLGYPIVADLDGLASPLLRPIAKRIGAMPPPERLRWLRTVGVEAVVLPASRRLPLPILRAQSTPDEPVLLQAVVDPMPRALWPEDFEAVGSVRDAFRHVSSSPDPVERPALLRAIEQGKLRSLEIVEWTPDRIVVDIDSDGGALVLRRAFQPLYRIRATGDDGSVRLRPLLANAFLLAAEAPAGKQRLEVEVSAVPEAMGFAVSLVTLVGCLLFLARTGRRRRSLRPETP